MRGLFLLLTIAALRLLLHVVGGLLESAADIGHLPVVVFAGELIELPREALGFFLQFLRARLIASTVATALLLLCALALEQLLLAFGEFLQLLERFIDGLGALVHFPALQCLVLILVLIQFELEQICEVFRALPRASPAATAALCYLDLVEQRFGAHQILKGLLFERLGRLSVFSFELVGRRIHLIDGVLEVFRQLLDRLVLIRQAAAGHALHDRVGLFGKLRLVRRDGVDVVLPLFIFELVLVVDELVRGRDDLFLTP